MPSACQAYDRTSCKGKRNVKTSSNAARNVVHVLFALSGKTEFPRNKYKSPKNVRLKLEYSTKQTSSQIGDVPETHAIDVRVLKASFQPPQPWLVR